MIVKHQSMGMMFVKHRYGDVLTKVVVVVLLIEEWLHSYLLKQLCQFSIRSSCDAFVQDTCVTFLLVIRWLQDCLVAGQTQQ